MALYTQFQDPGAVMMGRDQRRDEQLRNLMSMMLQMKQYDVESQHQMFRDERALAAERIAQQRADAYDRAVSGQMNREQSQWEARRAVAMIRWPQDLDKQQRYMLGESADDIDWTWERGYGEDQIKAMAEYAGTDPEKVKGFARKEMASLAESYRQSKYRFGNDIRMQMTQAEADRRSIETGISEATELAKMLETANQNDMKNRFSRTQKEADAFKDAKTTADTNRAQLEALLSAFDASPTAPLTDEQRRDLSRARQLIRAQRMGNYWWIPQEQKDEYLRRIPVDSGKANGPKTISLEEANAKARARGKKPQDIVIKPMPDGTNTAEIGGETYIIK